MNVRPYQPIIFNDLGANDSKNTQCVQDDDVTQFQFELSICDNVPNMIDNGSFDNGSTSWEANNWTISLNEASSSIGQNGMLKQYAFGSEQIVQVELLITDLIGDPLVIYLGTNILATITRPGNYTLYGKTSALAVTGVANNYLGIFSGQTNQCSIRLISAYPLETNFALYVFTGTSTTPFYKRTLAQDIADPVYTFFRIDRNIVTVSFDWNFITDNGDGLGQDHGCYRLGVSGICDNACAQLGVIDPTFSIPYLPSDVTFPWTRKDGATAPASVQFIGSQLNYLGSTGGVAWTSIRDVNAIPCDGKAYEYSFTLVIKTISNAKVTVSIGGTSSAVYTTSGTKTFILTSANDTPMEILIEDTIVPTAGVVEITLIQFSLDGASLHDVEYISNVFSYLPTQPNTLLLTASNNDDAFGLKFGSSFYNPQLRIKGTLRANNFDADRVDYIDSNNIKKIAYFSQRKTEELRLMNVPEYLVDWLSLFIGFSLFYVDTREFIAESDGSLEISYNRFSDSSKVSLIVGERRQELESTNQNGLTAVTNINNYLVEPSDIDTFIVLLGGDFIEIN